MKLSKEKMLKGKFFLHIKGFGFVQPEDDHPEVFIPPRKNKNAISGDTVIVRVLTKSNKGFEGIIDEVVKRERDEFVATVIDDEGKDFLLYSPLIGEDKEIYLPKENNTFDIGDRLTVKIIDYDDHILKAKLLTFLGNISDPSIDVKSAILAHRIKNDFPKEVVAEAKSYKIDKKDYKGRIDLREVETVTIDPTTAKDFDDAITLSKEKNGNYLLGVHIADVSHFVKKGSKLDQEAFTRANSTYFPTKVVPMLPEELSNNLCSLVEGEDRLTVSVLLEISPTGDVIEKEVAKTVINSDKRFTYDQAYDILSTKKKNKHRELLENMRDLCHIFKKKRRERGSVELALPDTQVICDEQESPTHIQTHFYDITHQMIEEFMLKANEIIAETLLERNKGGIFRVHDEPDSTNFDNFFAFVRLLGYNIGGNPTAHDIAKLFQRAKDSPHIEQIAIKYIRSQKLAIYSPDNIGHYGLGLENYSHFTSPIRRYSDLVVHRILFGDNYENDELKNVSTRCSENERKSFVAETSVVKLKKYRLLDRFFEKDSEKIYKGVLTNVSPKGITFDIEGMGIDGFIPIRELNDDFYIFEEKRMQLRGRNTGFLYTIGNRLNIQLHAIDLVFCEAEWALC